MKNIICTVGGAVGSFIAYALGGWDTAVITLLVFMAIDWIMGVILALVFHHSSKTASGGYSSKIGWQGLFRKCVVVLLVVVANLLDKQIGSEYIRDAVCIAFMINECISIIENASLMGVPIPKVLTDALDVLSGNKEEQKE